MSDTEIVERLAIELHRQYRAAEKALRCTDVVGERPYWQHDHGWQGCHRKPYFLQRAERILRHSRIENPETLGEAEQRRDAVMLLQKLNIGGCDVKVTGTFADGGEIPKGQYSVVGEKLLADDFHFPLKFHESGTANIRIFDREEIARIFQVPLSLLGWTDAQFKAERDAVIRKALWGPKPKYTVTAR